MEETTKPQGETNNDAKAEVKPVETPKTEVKPVETPKTEVKAAETVAPTDTVKPVETKTEAVEAPKVEVKPATKPVAQKTETVKPVEAPKTEVATPIEVAKVTTPQTEVANTIPQQTPKQMFMDAIAKTPFALYQNGVMICHSNPHLNIKTEEKYFEINFKKYAYTGVEIKHK